jgi:hypothetical protein
MLHHDESDSDHMKISAGQPSKHGWFACNVRGSKTPNRTFNMSL